MLFKFDYYASRNILGIAKNSFKRKNFTSRKIKESKGTFNYYKNYHKMIKLWTCHLSPLFAHVQFW